MTQESKGGFTLVELMTVIAIIALLSALILGLAGNAQKTSARKKAAAEVEQLSGFVTEYQTQYGKVPTLKALKEALKDADHPLKDMEDPWGDSYVYTNTSKATFYLYSWGGAKTNEAGWIGITP